MEYQDETGKGDDVKQGTDRSKDKQKFFDEPDIPSFWCQYILLINRIRRDGRLGDVVEKVIQQYLDRKKRKKAKMCDFLGATPNLIS